MTDKIKPQVQRQAQVMKIRGELVISDIDVAEAFGVETRALNQQVKRNISRFGDAYAFQLTDAEFANLKSQFVTSSGAGWGGRRKSPWVFTRDGVVMAATVLRSDRAVAALKYVVKTFNSVREQLGRPTDASGSLTALKTLRDSLQAQAAKIMQTVGQVEVRPETGGTMADEVSKVTTTALDELQAYMSKQQTQNQHVLADIQVKLAEAHERWANSQKIKAEARKANAEAGLKEIELAKAAAEALTNMARMIDQQDFSPVMDTLTQIASAPKPLTLDLSEE